MAKILIVDDEIGIRELLSEILDEEGYTVYAAENAEAARVLMSQEQFDLILLDIWMPDTDGITLLKEWGVRKMLNCPVIMMSGHGTIETAVEATNSELWHFWKNLFPCKSSLIPFATASTSKIASAPFPSISRLPYKFSRLSP